MFLILLETSSNQNYIFSTNKLRENVGASELTFKSCTKWVLEAVVQAGGHPHLGIWNKNSQDQDVVQENDLRQKLVDQTLNPPIEKTNARKLEIVLAASGKALILAHDKQTAKTIIQNVTRRVLEEAPGLDIFGVFEEFEWDKDDLSDVNARVHRKFVEEKLKYPPISLRFLRLPVVEECATSGLPATWMDVNTPSKKAVLRSPVARSKRKNYESNLERVEKLLKRHSIQQQFAESIKTLDDEDERQNKQSSWRAVIHADGNGLGEIFLQFGQHLNKLGEMTGDTSINNRTYLDHLRHFSFALDVCTERAFIAALRSFNQNSQTLPIVPLVLGGDDLTVVCDGQFALRFAQQFLKAFEAETGCRDEEHYNGIIPDIANVSLGVSRLSACAGVAIIKPHFPFSVAYELSEALMQSAKAVKRKVTHTITNRSEPKTIPYPCSALDFHVLYDSSGVELSQIRKRLESTKSTCLYIAPYIVTSLEQLNITPKIKEWANYHHWNHLEHRVAALVAKDEDNERRNLPNSQMHDLRNALLLGAELADARFKLIRSRYIKSQQGDRDCPPSDIRALEGDSESLFTWIVDPLDSKIQYRMTGLLDALDATDFLSIENFDQNEDG